MSVYFNFLPETIRASRPDKSSFPFSQQLFWDTPLEKIDTYKHINYIIERVLSRGLLADFYRLIQLYSRDEIISAVKKSRVLDNKTRNFCSHYFNIPITELHASSYYH